MKYMFLLLILFPFLHCFSQNDSIEQKVIVADKYFEEKEYNQALFLYKEAGKKNHTGALFMIGQMYQQGLGVEKNLEESKRAFAQGSVLGNYLCSRSLGLLFYEQKVDTEDTRKYLELAIEQGDEFFSCFMLAQIYSFGHGTLINKEMAIKLYKKAASHGEINSMYGLGCIYRDMEDNIESMRWWKKAGMEGDIDVLYKDVWNSVIKSHAEECRSSALYNVGYAYQTIYEDYTEAISWYKMAAGYGDILAQHTLGFTYYELNNITEAIKWSKMAADSGHAESQYNLGLIYEELENKKEAIKWYKMAADQGYEEAVDALKEILQ